MSSHLDTFTDTDWVAYDYDKLLTFRLSLYYCLCISCAAHLYHVVVKTHPKWVMKSYVLRCLNSYSLTRLNSNHDEETRPKGLLGPILNYKTSRVIS